MAKAQKQKVSAKASTTQSTSKKVAKKVSRVKKPAAAKKATRTKAAAPAKRRAATVARPKAVAAKKVARKVAAKAPKALSPKKASPVKPTVAAAPRVPTAAPAEFHSPATTVAKTRAAAAKTPVAKAPVAKVAQVTVASSTRVGAKATATKAARPATKAQRRPAKPTTLVVSAASIDTSLAAEVAATMVLNHMVSAPAAGHLGHAAADAFSRAGAAAASAPKRETSTFKHLKETVANPTSHHLDGLFGVLATQKRPKLPFSKRQDTTGQHIDKDFGLDLKRPNLLRRKAG